MSWHRALAALGSLLLAACQAASGTAGPAPTVAPAAPTPTAAATPSAPTAAVPPPPAPSATAASAAAASSASVPALLLAPPPAGAPAAEREATVQRLLLTSDASELPERAADADLELDPEREARVLWRMRPEPGMVHAPKVRMGDFTVSGGLPNEVVRRIFRQSLGRVRLCYEEQLVKKPKLEGTLRFDFTITLEGDLSAPRATALTLNEPALFACIAKATKDITFPQPEGAPIKVSVPISLAP